jgi:gamma-glutamyltranspeptidase/glutathione hydrolase
LGGDPEFGKSPGVTDAGIRDLQATTARARLAPPRCRRGGVLSFRSLAFLLWFGASAALAQEPAPIIGYAPRALPVQARHAMVAAQEGQAARIGLDALRRGGNAVDAAVAVGFALAVTLPRAGNLGGGGFMLIHRAATRETVAIDFRETAPVAATRDMFLNADGRADPGKSRASGLGVGAPGTVAGLLHALERYGSGKFSRAELIAPAAALARDGLTVSDDLADSLPFAAARLGRYPSSAKIFMPSGAPLREGDRLVQGDLAATLEAIGRDGARAFYEGPVAERIVAAVREAGGRMTLDDMKAYRVVERAPLRGLYRGHEVVSMPPPSAGGAHLIQLLNVLEGYPLGALGQNSAATIHLMAEAMKLAYADRARFLGDPDHVAIPIAGLLSKPYAARLRGLIDAGRARPAAEVEQLDLAPKESDQTTHFSVVDAEGNAVSLTTTLNFSYGLGLVAEGTGVLLNNELDDFAAAPGAANAYGLTGGEANAPGPNRRPLSSMTPTFVFRDGALMLATGSPGGSRIITIVLQMVSNIIDHGLNVAEASLAPRVHHQWLPDELQVERGLSPDTIRLLEAKGHRIVLRNAFGSAQSIQRVGDMWQGASDTRQRGGAAVGY